MLSETIANLASAASLFLLAWRFDGIGDMSRHEVLFMMGYIALCSGVQIVFCAQNNGNISRIIGRGQLEHFYIQPLSFPVQLLTMGFAPFTALANVVAGGVLMGIALANLSFVYPWWWGAVLVGSLLLSNAILLCVSYLFSSVAFYAPVAAEEISSYVMETAGELQKYPLSGMPDTLRIPLLTLFPAGLLAWFPSLVLLGKTPLGWPNFYPLLAAIPLFFLTKFVFMKGMRHYVRNGSNRYVPHGFRS
jgi:ABC-2 type transport system permease protein